MKSRSPRHTTWVVLQPLQRREPLRRVGDRLRAAETAFYGERTAFYVSVSDVHRHG